MFSQNTVYGIEFKVDRNSNKVGGMETDMRWRWGSNAPAILASGI